jgi:hypothetical protein
MHSVWLRHAPHIVCIELPIVRETVLRGTPGRPHGLPGVRAPRSTIAEDCGRLVICFSFPKHHLRCKAGRENLYPEGFVAVTAAGAGHPQRAIDLGAFALLYKPFDGEELLETVDAAIKQTQKGKRHL